MLSKHKREDGFTMVELLVVVVIIGLLSAIAIPIYSTHRKKAAIATVKSDINNVAILVEQDKARTGTYPTTIPTQSNGTGTNVALNSEGVVLSLTNLPATTTRLVPTACVQGYHQKYTTANDYWHYVISDKRLSQGLCPTA